MSNELLLVTFIQFENFYSDFEFSNEEKNTAEWGGVSEKLLRR